MAHPAEQISYRFFLYRGMPWSYKFGYLGANGQKVDMTGWVGRLDVRESVDSPDVLFSFTTLDGSMLLGIGEGELKILDPGIIEEFHSGVGHVVVGPTAESAQPIAFWGFSVWPTTTPAAP